MANNVEHVDFTKELNHKVMLRKLADDPELKGVVVVCLWEDETITTGHSEMNVGQLALGALSLQQKALNLSYE